MTTGHHYVHPPSLRSFLEGGGELSSFTLLDSLVEAVVVARRLLPAETNRKQAVRNRRFVERWFDRHGGEEPVPATQELLTFAFWKAECLEDPELADFFEAALPPDVLARGLQVVDALRHAHPFAVTEELLTFAFWKAECLEDPELADLFEAALPPDVLARGLQVVDALRHAHPFAVTEELTNWTCGACGENFASAPAAVVTNTGEELGYDTDLAYCLGCMSIATAALETASGIDRFGDSIDSERLALRPVAAAGAEEDTELILTDDDDDLLDDEEMVRREAARLTAQLEVSQRRMAALEARRAALIRRLEDASRRHKGSGGSSG